MTENFRNPVSRRATAWALALALLVPAAAAAGDDFLAAERRVLGPQTSRDWRRQFDLQQIGGEGPGRTHDEFGGGADRDEPRTGPSHLGRKMKAGLLSFVLPGAGQYYNGDRERAYLMGGIEAAIWTAFFVFDHQGDNRMDSAREWAGIYAGTAGAHPDSYWQTVGHYMDSDAYNEAVLREARALGETATGLVTGADAWQWVNEDRLLGYAKLRADGNSAYDRRDFMILFAVLNRAVSIVDAVLGAGGDDGALSAHVLGVDVEFALEPNVGAAGFDPGARWAVARSF